MNRYKPPLEELVDRVKACDDLDEKDRNLISKILMGFGQRYYEISGVMFICGVSNENENGSLPDLIYVCPGYGADVQATVAYRKLK